MSYKVSLEKCSSYDQDRVDQSIKKLLDNVGGISKFVKKGKKVLLKPNLVSAAKPQESMTTHPAIIEAIIKVLKDLDCEVFVGDNPFSENLVNAIKVCGIYEVCKKHGAKIADFDEKSNHIYEDAMVVKEFSLTRYFDGVDAIINLPKLKTHSQLYFTGAVKNLYSIMPGPRRGFYHLKHSNLEYFANMLLDLYALIRKKVVLNITDGIYGMEGNGPCNGTSKFAGILGASDDAVALDFVMCNLIGLDIEKLPTNYYALKRKDYLFDPKKIKILGEKIENIRIKPFEEAEYHTLNMMPKFVNNFKDYITKHKSELVY